MSFMRMYMNASQSLAQAKSTKKNIMHNNIAHYNRIFLRLLRLYASVHILYVEPPQTVGDKTIAVVENRERFEHGKHSLRP